MPTLKRRSGVVESTGKFRGEGKRGTGQDRTRQLVQHMGDEMMRRSTLLSKERKVSCCRNDDPARIDGLDCPSNDASPLSRRGPASGFDRQPGPPLSHPKD